MKKLESITLVAVLLVFDLGCFAQSRSDTRLSKLDLNLECGTAKHLKFRISNRTPYVISIPTGQNYFAWENAGGIRKPRTAKLDTGGSVFVLPDDVPINSILYFLERRHRNPSRFIVETTMVGSDSNSTSWIDKNSSIFFLVNRANLSTAERISVKFNYEWELNSNGVFLGGLNEHLAEFALGSSVTKVDKCK